MAVNKFHFRVDTPQFLKEIADNALGNQKMGVLFQPLNIFKNLLAQVAQRATELHDPILDKLMFDLSLYDLPIPTSKEYRELMEDIYDRADKQKIKENSPKQQRQCKNL